LAQEEISARRGIIPCDDLGDAIEIANGSSTVVILLYTKDVTRHFRRADLYTASLTSMRHDRAEYTCPSVHEGTGNGHREGGIGAIDFYTEWKSGVCGLLRHVAEGADRPGR